MTEPGHPIRFVAEAAGPPDLCWRIGGNEANGANVSWHPPREDVHDLPTRRFPDLMPDPEAPPRPAF